MTPAIKNPEKFLQFKIVATFEEVFHKKLIFCQIAIRTIFNLKYIIRPGFVPVVVVLSYFQS